MNKKIYFIFFYKKKKNRINEKEKVRECKSNKR